MKLNYSISSIILLLLLLVFLPANIFPQEPDITSYLKKIEAGEKEEVSREIPKLKQRYPASSSIHYLEALLTEDGEKSIQQYKFLVQKYPNSNYADDALYRIYSYFVAIDESKNAALYLQRLKREYPESPYIKLTEPVKFGEKVDPKISNRHTGKSPSVGEKKSGKKLNYTIQAGAFSSKENALKLKTDFDKAGYSSQVIEKSVGGSLFHVVYVGKYASDGEAKSFLQIINSEFKLQGWVVKLD